MNLIDFLTNNWDKLTGIVISFFSILLPLFQFINDKRKQELNKQFENYHSLIDELVGRQDKNPMLDRQLAIIFELRNFDRYFPITLRILNGLKENWENEINATRLINEINLTINYINSNFIIRKFFSRRLN